MPISGLIEILIYSSLVVCRENRWGWYWHSLERRHSSF